MSSPIRKPTRRHRVIWALVAVLAFAGVALFFRGLENVVQRKLAKTLITPVGLLWVFLWVTCIAAWWGRRRYLGTASLAIALAYSLAGNGDLGALAVGWLQRDYIDVDPFQSGQFDAVVVLGGTTTTAPNGQPQITFSGDRVLLAARLYHRGKTPLLVTSGERIAYFSPGAPSCAEETAMLWEDLGISREHILEIGGRNTGEEMEEIKRLVAENRWSRVGLVTSAWHMPRAMKEASRQEVDLTPLPAGFTVNSRRWTWLSLIPTAGGFGNSTLAFNECLAMAVCR